MVSVLVVINLALMDLQVDFSMPQCSLRYSVALYVYLFQLHQHKLYARFLTTLGWALYCLLIEMS